MMGCDFISDDMRKDWPMIKPLVRRDVTGMKSRGLVAAMHSHPGQAPGYYGSICARTTGAGKPQQHQNMWLNALKHRETLVY